MSLHTPLLLVLVFFSVVCHEIAHGLIAFKLGDPTAYRAGRLTFNPLPHIDILGTVILPLFLLVSGSHILFAWAKPVPVNPAYFRDPREGMMYVAMAGPGTNLAIAVALTILLHLGASVLPQWLVRAMAWGALINVVLMVFNLIPIPPLDGSRIVARFLEGRALHSYMRLERYGLFIVFGLLYLGVISRLLYPALNMAVKVLDLGKFLVRF
ncbi:site-2 protease family protein [Candidatus Fermentibacteria bacterium]|nr:site-2 protease family protein [Candidatus Fermentibacteria bacterium]